jgi:PAS domain S-box-containing protein
MKNKHVEIESRQVLRTEAEKLVVSISPSEITAQPIEILLHELLVHKIELEMQNEELRRAQATLEEARDRYIDLYEFAPVGYITITPDGLISEINLTGSSLLGVERTKLLKRRFSQFVAPPDKDHWYRLFLSMMTVAKGDKQVFDIEMLHANGSLFHAHLDCLRSEALNAPPTLRLALTDISKSKQIEKELRIAATAFEAQESIFVTDSHNIILKVNHAFTSMTGYSADEAIGQTPKLLSSGQHNPAFYTAMNESLDKGGVWQGEIRNRRKNGEIYSVWLTITAIYGDDGAVLHYVAISR